MTVRTTPQIICDILKEGLDLCDDQIWIGNQRRSIPEDKRLYVVVSLLTMTPYGNNARISESGSGLSQELTQYMSETITVDLLSYTTEAQERYSEILAALASQYSQGLQEEQALRIFPIPSSMVDVSMVEGAARIFRIAITFTVFRKYEKILSAPYYDLITPGYIALTDK